MRPVVLYLPWGERLGRPLGEALDAAHATLWMHRFPDGEARVRIDGDLAGRSAIVVASLDRPDAKLLPLLFALATARDLGARSVGLVAPYLPYMRQDLEFHRGEGMSARHFAELLSRAADWVLTVDPHLHRIHRLDELFTVPVEVAHSAPAIAEWIRAQVARPLVIGPDEESEQWVEAVARAAGAPWAVLAKHRRGDREVELRLPDLGPTDGREPVLVDDIISTGATMRQAVTLLREAGFAPPRCVAVHAVLAGDAEQELIRAGAHSLVTCNTLAHPTNRIDVLPAIIDGVRRLLAAEPEPALAAAR
jgi:ribose-phosphate pyrophosphokinase